ncbi:MAG: rhomboid family intramembrane serine protease [Bacilli bacterium]|nr:rhomboid family intramembrane serine protease [Bacilli bacterium]
MNELVIDEKEELVMKLLHYFITEKGYNPIVLHGGKDEIWLENIEDNNEYGVVRIVSGYIHNNEQFSFDSYKTKQIIKQIKKKTFSLSINTLSIYVDLGDNVKLESTDKVDCVYLSNIDDIDKYDNLKINFPTLKHNLNIKEKGINLFSKLTTEINKSNEIKAKKNQDIFAPRKPIVTYTLIIINVILYILSLVIGKNTMVGLFGLHPELVKAGEYYRIITCMFMHASTTHLLFNMYALYIIGSQIESFFNKFKYIIIYLISGILGCLFSMIFTQTWSVGASGAIFGLLGSMLYFGYHHRMYLGTVIKSQIIPVIVINLIIGFSSSSIDNAAHIGGLIGGILASMMVGVKDRDDKIDKVNGFIITVILVVFLIYLAFFMN